MQLFASGLYQRGNVEDDKDKMKGFLKDDIFKEKRRAQKLVSAGPGITACSHVVAGITSVHPCRCWVAFVRPCTCWESFSALIYVA